jgi:hypothetical protein
MTLLRRPRAAVAQAKGVPFRSLISRSQPSLLLTLASLSLFAADAPKVAPAEKVAVNTKFP